jgi:hypothetical protein
MRHGRDIGRGGIEEVRRFVARRTYPSRRAQRKCECLSKKKWLEPLQRTRAKKETKPSGLWVETFKVSGPCEGP